MPSGRKQIIPLDPVLFRGALTAFGITGVSLALGFVVQLLLVRSLGQEQYGAYAFAFGCVNIAVIVAKFDLDTVSTRFGGAHASREDWGGFRTVSRAVLVASALIAVALAAFSAAGLVVFREVLPPGSYRPLLAALAIVPPMAVLAVSGGLLQAMGHVMAAQFPTGILRSVVFLLILSILFLRGGGVLAEHAVLANTIGTAVALALSLGLLHRAIPGTDVAPLTRRDRADWFTAARGALVVSIGQILLSTQTDIVLVGIVASPRDAAFYSVASQLAALTALGIVAVQSVVGPRIAALYSAGELDRLQQLVDSVRRTNLLLALPLILVMIATGHRLLLIFGPEYPTGSYPILVILCFASLSNPLLGNMGGFLLTLTGHQDHAARIVGVSTIAYFALAFVLGPRFGSEGIAASTALAFTLRAVLLHRYARNRIGVNLLGR